MKKKAVIVFLAIVLAVGSTGCGGETAPESTPVSAENLEQSSQTEETSSEQSSMQESSSTEEESPSRVSQEQESTDAQNPQTEQALLNLNKKTLSWSEYEENYQLEVQREVFALDEECAAHYPALNQTLQKLAQDTEKEAKESYDTLLTNCTEAAPYESEFLRMYDLCSGTILRADDKVFSVAEQSESYYGGAHGGYYYSGMAFDAQSGKRLELFDVVKDEKQLREIAAKELKENYKEVSFYEDVITAMKQYPIDKCVWVLEQDGVTLVFNQYELAPYSGGIQCVEISCAEYPDLLENAYFDVPETYVQRIESLVPYQAEIDGKTEQYELQFQYEQDAINSVVVNLDGTEYQADIWGYDKECYYVKCKDTAYLYLFLPGDNDYVSMTIFDFQTGEFREGTVDDVNLRLPVAVTHEESGENGYYFETIEPQFVHPEAFRLSSNLETLSSYLGTRTYRVGENGIPEAFEKRFAADTYFLLKTKTDVPCRLVTPAGEVVEENGVIPAGTFFQIMSADRDSVYGAEAIDYVVSSEEDYLYRTDENTKLQMDVLYEIRLDEANGWTLGGVSIMELFDGLNFTG